MVPSIILLTLLISSVCAVELKRLEFTVNELDQNYEEIPLKQLLGACWACKWAMGKVRSQLSNHATKTEIKKLLASVCDYIGFLRFICRLLVNKYMGTLIEELSTTDNPQTICANIGIC